MKKIILPTIFFLSIAGFASAQTTKNRSSKPITYTSTSSHKAKKPADKKISNAKVEITNSSATAIPDNRKEYVKDGQLATPTGHDAAPTNGEQFQSLKDTAKKRKQ